jgi:hypothetical protein
LFKYLYPSSKKKMVSPSSLSQRGWLIDWLFNVRMLFHVRYYNNV